MLKVGTLCYWGYKLQNVNPMNVAFAPPGWINVITLSLGAGYFFIAYILFLGLVSHLIHIILIHSGP